MTKILVAIIFVLTTMQTSAQVDRKQSDNTSMQNTTGVTYRLFPTQNMWTFLKLNTRTGQMWQVQFGMKSDSRFVTNLNSEALVSKNKETNDRFTLYSTQNMYTFILFDQFDGKTWQVQWSTDANNRGVIAIE